MADISKIKTLDGTTYDLKDAIARYHLPYGVCETGANTTDKTVTIEGITELTAGLTVAVKFTNNNAMVGPTLNVNGLGAKTIKQYGTVSVAAANETSGWMANSLVILVYDGTYWYFNKGYNTNSTYTVTTVDCLMAGNSGVKRSVNSSYYVLQAGNIFECTVQSANTYASELTLNINNTGPKPIYINGQPSSTTNYSIPAGKYLVYYDGNVYHFRTDKRQPINIQGTVNGYSINKSVPSNAVFTDTTYDAATATPLMDGTGSVGTSVKYAREDHRHPSDTTKYTINNYGQGTTDVSIRPLIAYSRANRFAFLPADQIIIETTTDGGTTWVSGGYSDDQKRALFATRGTNINIPLLNGAKSTQCGVRITITGMKYNVPSGTAETGKYAYWNSTYVNSQERYSNLREMWFWISSNNDAMRVQVFRATGANSNNWVTDFNTDFPLTGWSGSDWIRLSGNTFGGGTTQTGNYWNWRIIFWSRMHDGDTAFRSATQQSISGIAGYGDSVWGTPNGMMKEDHLYTWDYLQNATFPAEVRATSFSGTLYGTATKATQDESGNNIKASYASSMSISDHTITLKNKNGASLGTVTVPDNNTTYTANTSKLVTTTVPNVTSAGSAPTLGMAIPADDITAWSTNTPTSATVTNGIFKIANGSAASLSYTAKSIPNVTSVGSAPTLGTAITVATGSLASNGGGGTVATGITAS